MNLSGIDLNLLPIFEALLEERSVSLAAKRVGLSQPAMSNALSRLRSSLGDPLFIRQGRTMEPTPLAKELGTLIHAALSQIRGALGRERTFDPVKSSRSFRISMADSTEWRLGAALADFALRESGKIRLQFRRLDELFRIPEAELRAGALDLAVGYFPDTRSVPLGISMETLTEEENCVVLRHGHPALSKAWNIEQFAGLEHAAIIYRSEPWGLIDSELASRGFRRQLRLASPHFVSVLKAVSESNLAAVVPASLAADFGRQLGLQSLPVPFPFPTFVTRMAWVESLSDNPDLVWLRTGIRDLARQI